MFSQSIILSIMAASAAIAAAVPNPHVEPHCDDYYLVDKWNVTVTQPHWDSTRFGTFKGCANPFKSKRDGTAENPDTKVETTDARILTSYVDGSTVPEDEIWGRALELCGETFCDGQKEISVSSGRSSSAEGTELYLSLDGEFPDGALRDNFLSLLKDAFYKSIDEEVAGEGLIITHNAVAFGNAVSSYGDASGYSLTFRMREGNPGSGPSCPDAINTINSFGALVPELGVVFGFAAAICGGLS